MESFNAVAPVTVGLRSQRHRFVGTKILAASGLLVFCIGTFLVLHLVQIVKDTLSRQFF